MSTSSLSPSSYVILGLIARNGPSTPYELKKQVDCSVGFFWSFPRAQLYVEPDRLASLGLLTEQREESGRRRRVYSLTEAGRSALMSWLVDGGPVAVEMRDAGLLKLHFAGLLGSERVADMGRAQADLHRQRLAEYERIVTNLRPVQQGTLRDFSRDPLRLGLAYERVSIEFWEEEVRRAENAAHETGAQSEAGTEGT